MPLHAEGIVAHLRGVCVLTGLHAQVGSNDEYCNHCHTCLDLAEGPDLDVCLRKPPPGTDPQTPKKSQKV
eukprot:4867332-Amphidinium_carterae.1